MPTSLQNNLVFQFTGTLTTAGTTVTISNDLERGQVIAATDAYIEVKNKRGTKVERMKVTIATGTLTASLRGLDQSDTNVEVASLKKEWKEGSIAYITILSVQLPDKTGNNTWSGDQIIEGNLIMGTTDTTKYGLKVKKLTTAQKNALSSPPDGAFLLDETLGAAQMKIGGTFQSLGAGATTPNMSESVTGKGRWASIAQALAGTDLDGSEPLVIKPSIFKTYALDRLYSLPMVAGENLTAGNLVYVDSDGKAYKTVRSTSANASVGAVTGLDSDPNFKMLKIGYLTDDTAVIVYKKSSDNIGYATVVTFSRGTITVGTEVAVTSTMTGNVGADLCILSSTLFVVGFTKLADTKAYATACAVSGTTVTVGTEVKMYDSDTVNSHIVNVAKITATKFVLGFRNFAGDDPLVVVGSIAGTVITAGTAVQVESTTMAGYVKVCYAEDNVAAVWYDDGTNIKFKMITVSTTTITLKTAMTTSITGAVDTGDSALFIEYGRFILVRNGTSSITRIITVNVADQSAWTVGVLAGNYTLPNDWNTSGCILASATYLGRNKLAIVNQTVLGADARFRLLDLGYNDAAIIFDATITGTVGDINLCKLTNQQDKVLIVWRETGTTNLAYSLYWNTENQCIGSVLTTTLAAASVPITVSGPVAVTGLTAGLPYYVGDAGTVATSGTKQIGVALTTSSLLLR